MEWFEHAGPAWFVTLTYNPDNLPENGTLEKKKFLQWIKDTQRRRSDVFRYYAVGEYGDKSHRPHYHMAVFLEHPAQIDSIRAAWENKGFTQASELNTQRARYLANYTAKKLTKTGDPRLAGREPEFRTSSRNPPLGSAFVEKVGHSSQAKRIVELTGDAPRTFTFQGKQYPVGDWALGRLRTQLGVPDTVQGRREANPNYNRYYYQEGATWDPEAANKLREQIDAKKAQGYWRGKGSKV